MESNNRTVWIIVAVIVVVLCCCALAVAVAAVGWFAAQPLDWAGVTSLQSERSEEAFVVGETPSLKIDNFAGNVTVRAGERDVIRVVATKKAPHIGDLGRIEIQIDEQDGGLAIRTSKPSGFTNASVELEITAPASTRLDLDNGAGNVDVDGLTGKIDAHTGAGNMDVRGAAGTARLDTGAGNIDYQGMPQGECRFETGAGNIRLVLPADLNVQADLDTGLGNIDVDYVVDGQVTRTEVNGVIGDGSQGSIYVQSGTGNIDLIRR
ncbi:MAG: hypothetical protein PVF77_11880 [Anaerolineae bacterium]|jgi:DUF4097 and DUF4098 domain-containing protein YvlB